ncbi:MAG: alpha/beta hydrolase [Planctomycetota bacterium]
MHIILSIVTIYLLVVFLMMLVQRRMIYFPSRLEPDYRFEGGLPGFAEVNIPCPDGVQVNALFVPPPEGRPLVLCFHGNGGCLADWEYLVHGFYARTCGVLVIDFHGYGKTGGRPSETTLYRNAEAAVVWLKDTRGITPDRIIVFGKSLGTGAAVEIATRYKFKGLILDSAFTSLAGPAAAHYPFLPVRLMLLDKYDNLGKIGRINCPLLVIHGNADSIVPYTEGVKLFTVASEPKQMYTLEGGDHNDNSPPEYWATIRTWIDQLK